MDFKALEYICAISEAKTISQAAKNLFISQPALSQYLSKIEQSLGTPVFVRSGNVMTLTSAGEILVREGRALLMAREEMMAQVTGLSSAGAETLCFGVSPFYSKYYLPLLLPYYRAHFPHIRLKIIEQSSTELEQQVLDGTLDLCFIPAEPMREGLTYRPIYMEEIMIALPPAHPGKRPCGALAGRALPGYFLPWQRALCGAGSHAQVCQNEPAHSAPLLHNAQCDLRIHQLGYRVHAGGARHWRRLSAGGAHP